MEDIQDERRPSPCNVEKTFNIEKEIKHAVIVECDENPYYEEFDVSLRNYKHLWIIICEKIKYCLVCIQIQ